MSLGALKSYATILLLFMTGTAAAQFTKPEQRAPHLSNRELAAQVRRSLVVVLTQDHEGNTIAQGSGFFFKPGLIATSLHVLKRASQGYVKSVSENVSYQISSVVGFDLNHDLCVLKLSEAAGTPLPLGVDDVSVGDDVLAAGNPEGLEATFSKGIVSAIRPGSGLIQMDAPISPGSSGGPVVNSSGEVIGLAVSTLLEGQNLNFAAPIRYLRGLRLVWDLRVETVGGLAVTDREDDGFRGVVQTVTETYASYAHNEGKNTYVEGPAELLKVSRYSSEGRLEESTNFINGVEDLKTLREYSDDGLVKTYALAIGERSPEKDKISPASAVQMMDKSRHFGRTVNVGTKGDGHYEEDKYDDTGHIVEKTIPQRGIRDVIKYDSFGREIETLEYKQGDLVSAVHSTYEDNERGDWLRRHETLWVANEKDSGFTPLMEDYREITYYGPGGGKR